MAPPRRLIARTVIMIGVVAAAVVCTGTSAVSGVSDATWVAVAGEIPLFDLTDIAPGDTGAAMFTVTNPQAVPVQFSMAVVSLSDDDRGCNEPEAVFGDTSCGVGGGELQLDLRLRLIGFDATGATTIADGTLNEWASRAAVDAVALQAHEVRSYRVTYELPTGSSNRTQTDVVAFQFELRLEQVGDTPVGSEALPVVIGATGSLPGTGGDVRMLTTVGMTVAVVGLGLYRWGVRKRRST